MTVNPAPGSPPGHVQIDEKDDGKLEPLRRVDGHEIDAARCLDDGIGFIAGAQRLEVVGQPSERGVAAAFDAADQRAHLLDVLARLVEPAAAKFVQ